MDVGSLYEESNSSSTKFPKGWKAVVATCNSGGKSGLQMLHELGSGVVVGCFNKLEQLVLMKSQLHPQVFKKCSETKSKVV